MQGTANPRTSVQFRPEPPALPNAEGALKRTQVSQIQDAALLGQFADTLRERGPLAGLAAESVSAFIRHGAWVELEPGEALIREGEAAGEFYLLLEGALAVKSKGETLARIDRPGDVVGEAAALLGQKRTADVVAESAVRAIAIPAQALKQPEFADAAAGIRSNLLRDDWIQY